MFHLSKVLAMTLVINLMVQSFVTPADASVSTVSCAYSAYSVGHWAYKRFYEGKSDSRVPIWEMVDLALFCWPGTEKEL